MKFEIYYPGEKAAGLRSFTDTVTVSCDSNEWGGAPGEFEQFTKESLETWYDGANVRRIN